MNAHLIWTVLLLAIAVISAGQADAKSVNEEYRDGPETARAEYGTGPLSDAGAPNLHVSAQRQSSNNSFGGPLVIEVIVDDPYISGIYIDQQEPNVTVNGVQLRMAQTRDGDWHAYMAESDMVIAADSAVAFGHECSDEDPFSDGFFAAKNAYCNIRIIGGDTYFYGTYTDAVRGPKELGPYDAGTNRLDTIYDGQIGIPSEFWPVIQAFDFEDGQTVNITYYERGGPQAVQLTYTESMDRYSSSYVDKPYQAYVPGQQVHMTIDDMLLNIDPTDEDTWTFSTHPDSSNTGLYYQLYDEYGSRPELFCQVSEVCRIARPGLGFGDAGALTIYLEDAPNINLVDNGQQSLTGAQRLAEYGDIPQPLTFVETGPNTGIFTNTDRAGVSSLVVADTTVSSATQWEYAGQTNQIRFNRMPELDPVGNRTVVAGSELRFNTSAADPDGNHLTYGMTGQPAGATINATSGVFVWTPTVSDFGVHVFTITVYDGLASAAEIITVNVTLPEGANRPPVAPDVTVNASQTVTVIIMPQIRDPEGDDIAITDATGATKGQINTDRLGEGIILYTPDAGARGTDSITYTVSDDRNVTSTGTITVIIAANTRPTASDFNIRVFAGIPSTVDLGASGLIFDNEDNASLAVSLARAAAQGSVAVSGTTVTYTANQSASGDDQFHYAVTDAGGLSDTGTVSVAIDESRRIDTLIADGTRSLVVHAGEAVAFAVATGNAGSYQYILAGQPAGASIDLLGNFGWTPSISQTGTHRFTVTMYNGTGAFDLQHVTVTVLEPDNTPPRGSDIEMFADAGATASDDISDILYDAEDDGITVAIARQPAQGDATAEGTVLSYAADPDAAGSDSFEYRLTDEHGASSVWTVTVRIGADPPGPNRNPVAPDFTVIVPEGRPTTITPQISDPDGNHVFIRSATGAVKGATVATEDSITYTPRAGQTGIDIITYTVSDGRGGTDTGMITVRIDAPNNDPELDYIADIVAHVRDDITFVASAGDPDDDALVFGLDGQPAGATINATTGLFRWTPAPLQAADHTLTVTVSDGRGGADSQDIGIVVHAENTPPEGRDVDLSVGAGTTVSDDIGDILYDREEDRITVTLASRPVQGDVGVDGTVLYYTARADARGVDSFEYRLTDEHGASSVWTVTLRLGIQSNATVNHPPVAPDIQISTELDFPIPIRLSPTDPDGDNVTITRVTGATKGTIDASRLHAGHITYLPMPGQTGMDVATYTVSDDYGDAANGTITIYINAHGNSRPVLDAIGGKGVNAGNNLNFTATAGDADGHDLTFGIANAPQGATINATTGLFSWTPDTWQIGRNTATITVYDGHGGGRWQYVDIFVSLPGTVNRDPVVENITTTVVLGAAKGFQPVFSDPDGDDAAIESVSPSSLGDVDTSYLSVGVIIYIAGVLGDDEVVYTVSDGRGGTANGTIAIEVVEPTNVRPIIEFIGDKSINANSDLAFTAAARDIDGFVTGFGLVGAPGGASMTGQGVFRWTPTGDDVGRHEFAVIVFDDAGENSTESIAVTVRPEDYVNSAPAAPDVVIMTPQDILSIARPTLTDPDEGDPVRISQTGDSAKGRILSGFLRAGIIIYLPHQGESGIETVSYTAADSSNGTDTAVINIFISARGNVNPILGSIDFRNINAGQPLGFDLEAEDPDNGTISYMLVGAPGAAAVSPQGAFSWTPAAADVGNHTFTVIAYDDRGGADSKSAVIRVLPAGTANRAPDAPDSSVTVSAGGSVVITPAISDPDGDRVSITDAVASGTGVVIQSEDSINYVHVATTPTETITYTVTDARGATAMGTITITVR